MEKINQARAAHPDRTITEILPDFPGVTKSNYSAWSAKARNGSAQEFPLAVIPQRPKSVKKVATGYRTTSPNTLDFVIKLLTFIRDHK